MLSARVRSRPSAKLAAIRASTAGEAIAPPAPWMARAASSHAAEVARPPASDAAVNSVMPAMNTRRRPRISPARPPSSSRPPNVSVYALRTQDRLGSEKCRPVAMLGSAMFTTVKSRMIMSWAPSTRARATVRRSGRCPARCRARVVTCAIDEVDIDSFLTEAEGKAGGGPSGRECPGAWPALATM